jgi:N-acetylmuramoyl-L-alanine amidase
VNIVQRIVPADHAIRSNTPMTPKWITIHETANTASGANAEMHARYMLSHDAIQREVLWHATVDSGQVIQHLPWGEVGWHAGDGLHGPGNTLSIGIELCVNSDGDFEATKRNAAWLIAHLTQTVPSLLPFPECVVQHNHWSGKDCPHRLRATPGAWDAFVGLCKAELDKAKAPAHASLAVTVNGRPVEIGARLEEGKTRVDLRPLAEALGAVVTWIPLEQGGPRVNVTLKHG